MRHVSAGPKADSDSSPCRLDNCVGEPSSAVRVVMRAVRHLGVEPFGRVFRLLRGDRLKGRDLQLAAFDPDGTVRYSG